MPQVTEPKWFFEALENNNPVIPQHAIIDEDGTVVVGMVRMSEATAREICQNHNKLISE